MGNDNRMTSAEGMAASRELADRIAETMQLNMSGADPVHTMACAVIVGRMVGQRASSPMTLATGLRLLTMIIASTAADQHEKKTMGGVQ